MKEKVLFLLALLLASCTSVPPVSENRFLTPEQETQIAERMTRGLERTYAKRNSPNHQRTVEKYIQKLVREIGTNPDGTRIQDVKLNIIDSEKILWAAGLDRTVYISTSLLRQIQFENELAFALATQIELLEKKVPQMSFSTLQTQEFSQSSAYLPMNPGSVVSGSFVDSNWFEKGGFFDFGETVHLHADKVAIQRLVFHRYDPRGGISLLTRLSSGRSGLYANSPIGKILPPIRERIEELRNEVAKTSPLRNPIVKSDEFNRFLRHLNQNASGKNKSS